MIQILRTKSIFLFFALVAAAFAEHVQAASDEYNSCINNQRIIVGALHGYALEQNLSAGTAVKLTNLVEYLKGGEIPTCPLGGTYPDVLTASAIDPIHLRSFCSLGDFEGHTREIKRLRGSSPFWPYIGLVVVITLVSGGLAFFLWRVTRNRVKT